MCIDIYLYIHNIDIRCMYVLDGGFQASFACQHSELSKESWRNLCSVYIVTRRLIVAVLVLTVWWENWGVVSKHWASISELEMKLLLKVSFRTFLQCGWPWLWYPLPSNKKKIKIKVNEIVYRWFTQQTSFICASLSLIKWFLFSLLKDKNIPSRQ